MLKRSIRMTVEQSEGHVVGDPGLHPMQDARRPEQGRTGRPDQAGRKRLVSCFDDGIDGERARDDADADERERPGATPNRKGHGRAALSDGPDVSHQQRARRADPTQALGAQDRIRRARSPRSSSIFERLLLPVGFEAVLSHLAQESAKLPAPLDRSCACSAMRRVVPRRHFAIRVSRCAPSSDHPAFDRARGSGPHR